MCEEWRKEISKNNIYLHFFHLFFRSVATITGYTYRRNDEKLEMFESCKQNLTPSFQPSNS
jgi:hypothetical protein